MASYKSQFAPPRRIEDHTLNTRLPKRSITPTTITSQLPTGTQSKLQKRRPSRDEPAHLERGSQNQKELVQRVSSRQPSGTAASATVQAPGLTTYKARSTSSSSRLPKLEVPVNTRTPSLVSGSSASTIESPRSNVLRRKQPSVGVASSRHALRTRDDSMSSQEGVRPAEDIPGGFKDPFSESVFGISLPPSSTILARAEPELESAQTGLYDEIGPLDIYPTPTPQYAFSATPSTRYADSPGAFSISSTATSMTSYSPATALSKPTYRVRQVSPLESRPPVSRQRAPEEPRIRTTHGLSTVRESSTSSSSASTVVADLGKADLAKKQLPTVPQSPPVLKPTPVLHIKPRVQPVPELAHLVDPSPVSPPTLRRPSRPSRDGTPEILGLRDPSPVIQSNMNSFPTTHRRTSSTDSKFGSISAARSRMGVPVKSSSRNPSPAPSSNIPSLSGAPRHGSTLDAQRERDTRRSSTLPAPVPAPSPSKTSRFGFFSRRTKTDPAPHTSKSESKLVRRGPAAGTGHEGYGKHASRGRSSSSIGASVGRSASAGTTSESLTQTPSTRKSSMTSTTSGEMDDFFLNRLTPVILRGAGSSSELTRSPEPMHSSSSVDLSARPKPVMGNTTSVTSESSYNRARPKLLPSAMPNTMRSGSPAKKMIRRPSESDDDTKKSFLPTIAARRTSRITKPSESVISPTGRRSASRSRKDVSTDEGNWLRSSKKNKAEKEKERPKPSKWNFFSRAHAAPRVETPAVDETAAPASPGPASRSIAHYALMGAQSGLDMEDIEQLMKEAAGATDTESVLSDNDSTRKERMQSMLLPPKPILPAFAPPSRPASPKVILRPDQSPQRYGMLTVNTDVQSEPEPSPRHSQAGTIFDLSPPSSPFTTKPFEQDEVLLESHPAPLASEPSQQVSPALENVPPPSPPPMSPPPRPSRLPQVGRIPQVISSRRQPRQPSSRSFSRPFATDQPRPSALPRTSFDSIGSMVATAGPAEPFPILQGLGALSHGTAIATISPFSEESRQSEFFKFPPRKDSEVSYSSSSGVWSFAPTAGTAIVPMPEAPLSEDELWNEYDDLLDQVVSPGGTVQKSSVRSQHPSLEPLPLKTKTSCVSVLSGTSENEAHIPSVHLRRSRLLAALHAQSPTSSMALSDVINDYGERKLSVVDSASGRLSLPLSPSLSTTSEARRSTRTSLPASLPMPDRQSKTTITSRSDKDRDSLTISRYRDSRLMDIAEAQADGYASMADLRFGALMTSKWLSFGRVLFSPVHFQLKDANEDRVLVIDGLGKDWSFYCALTYSEAAVYDLGPAPSSSASADRTSGLPNHRHIRHSSLNNAFPYPCNFFACVVLRFPSALPSSTHNFLLSEAKRVLRPGGYLEFSVLDLDLVNMGNRARRAVRGLKMAIHHVDETISLRNISDEIIAGLGRKRFVECKSCVVGVPVAGKLPTPNDMNHPMRKNSTASSRGRANINLQPPKGPKSELSFSDLLNTSTPSESTDKGIAEKVARVGRWWYSRCYESIVLPDGEGPDGAPPSDILKNSIWRDESLISECEKRGTSFRLLIGYAQKPEVGVRRTVSV